MINNQLSNKTQLMRALDGDSAPHHRPYRDIVVGARMTSDLETEFSAMGPNKQGSLPPKAWINMGKTNLYIEKR